MEKRMLRQGTTFHFNGQLYSVLAKLPLTSSDSTNKIPSNLSSLPSFSQPRHETYIIEPINPPTTSSSANKSSQSPSELPSPQSSLQLSLRILRAQPNSYDFSEPQFHNSNNNNNNSNISMTAQNTTAFEQDYQNLSETSKEHMILSRISKHPCTISCYGKTIVFDEKSTPRECLILQKIDTIQPLADYLDQTRASLDLTSLIHVAASVVSSFVCFEYERIMWNDEISLSNFSFLNDTAACITSGFSTCTILPPQPLLQLLPSSTTPNNNTTDNSTNPITSTYTYKKNCAQIKSIVFGILSRSSTLTHKYMTPSNIASKVANEISPELRQITEQFTAFDEIFTDYTLVTLIAFIQHAASLTSISFAQTAITSSSTPTKHNPHQSDCYNKQSTIESPQSYDKSLSFNRGGTIDSQLFSNSVNGSNKQQQMNKSILKKSVFNYDEDSDEKNEATEGEEENFSSGGSQTQQQMKNLLATKLKLAAANHSKFQPSNTSNIINSDIDDNINDNNNNTMKPPKKRSIGFVEIELQDQSSSVVGRMYVEADTEYSTNGNSKSIQYQQQLPNNNNGPLSSSFRSKSNRLKDEENEDIKAQCRASLLSLGLPSNSKQRKSQIDYAKQILIDLESKREQIKQVTSSSFSSQNPLDLSLDNSGSASNENPKEVKLLFKGKLQNDSLIPDNILTRVILGLVFFLLIGGIIFGAVFHFGVSQSDSQVSTIQCDDSNCERCDRYADVCTICKESFVIDSVTKGCVNACSVSNCNVCLKQRNTCEGCAAGYTLALNTCVLNANSCPAANCKACKDLACVECSFGFKMNSSGNCVKKCVQASCSTCLNDPQVCTQCEGSATLNSSGICT